MWRRSHEGLENTAQQLYSSPPHLPTPEELLIKMPQNVPPTPGTALQHRIDKIEKSLGSQMNIQLQQQMGVFEASIMESLDSLRDS